MEVCEVRALDTSFQTAINRRFSRKAESKKALQLDPKQAHAADALTRPEELAYRPGTSRNAAAPAAPVSAGMNAVNIPRARYSLSMA
jgi:hypothetical protein